MEGLECQDKTFVLSYLRQAPDMCITTVVFFFFFLLPGSLLRHMGFFLLCLQAFILAEHGC